MNPVPTITADELRKKLDSDSPPLLIDVMPEEEFTAQHLPGAKNACVYNVTFLDDVKKLAPSPDASIVLYDSSTRNLASTTAAEKLNIAGYTQLSDFRGGLEEWRATGNQCHGDPAAAQLPPKPADGRHELDLEKSRVEWTGRSLMGAHHGTVKLKAGHIDARDGLPVGGSMTLDMSTIENADIEDAEMRQLLIHHLKSDDFFDVERYPDAVFELTDIISLFGITPGTPNTQITGKLTLKGVTRDARFPAVLGPAPDGSLAADAHFEIDRTLWNVRYGSGKYFEKLGKHLVNDSILIGLKVVTVPRP